MIIARDQLRSIVERVERIHEERKSLGDDIRDVYAEAKGGGFDVKALKDVIRLRRQEPGDRIAHSDKIDEYMLALGMVDENPTIGLSRARTREEPASETPAAPKPTPTPAPRLVSSFDPGEMPDIPPELDRRPKKAVA